MKVVGIVVALVALLGVALILFRKGGSEQSRRSRTRPQTRRPTPGPRAATPGPAQKQPASRRHVLVGQGGEVEGKSFHVGERVVTIGRAPTNFIQLLDTEASRKHCQLSPTPKGLRVLDMSSRNGVYVDGEKAGDVLTDGSELRIGQARFRYLAYARMGQDDALGRKEVRARVQQSTIGASTDEMDQLLRHALEQANGDLEAAAATLRIDPQALRDMAERRGITL